MRVLNNFPQRQLSLLHNFIYVSNAGNELGELKICMH